MDDYLGGTDHNWSSPVLLGCFYIFYFLRGREANMKKVS